MADAIDQHVGARVCARRRALGLTLQQLAVAAGTTLQQIHKYEVGESRMSPARLWLLAKALGVDVNYLFDGFDGSPCDRSGRRHRAGTSTGAP
jgi:transcriptional regulator with XRE-family HTH domain